MKNSSIAKTARTSSPPCHDRTGKFTSDPLLTTKEAATVLALSHRTLEALRLKGGGPPFVQVTSKAIRYRLSDLQNWIAGRTRKSTSDTESNFSTGNHFD